MSPENEAEALNQAIEKVYALIDETKEAMQEHLEWCNEVAVAIERLDEARLWYTDGLVKHPMKVEKEEEK